MVMMYISVLPIAISVRKTNVYEEKSLGIYNDHAENADEGTEPSYVGTHLRRQLSFDLWYIFLGLFLIAIIEGDRIQDTNDAAFTMFSVLFEVVSAYGTVGLSLGYPGTNASFSAQFRTLSKLVIIAMQIRGRHRGLPYDLDRAVLLPSESLLKKERDDANQRARRRSDLGDPESLQRSRTRSSERGPAGGRNFLTGMLHPGPSIPVVHRNKNSDGFQRDESGTTRRRHSFATTGMRGDDGENARPATRFFGDYFSGADAVTINGESERPRKVEGRRHFFQEGVNPPPEANIPATAQAPGKTEKQA